MGKKAAPKKEEEAKEEPAAAVAGAIGEAVAAAQEEEVALTPEAFAQYDLTSKITPYLDRHLIFPLLNTLSEVGVYDKADVAKVENELLAETCMIDLAIERYENRGEDVPEELSERREVVCENLAEMQQRVYALLEIFEDSEKVEEIRKMESLQRMLDKFELEPEIIDELLKFAKMTYDCGNYVTSLEVLKHYRQTLPRGEEVTSKYISAIWGSLACELLSESGEASELILKLDELLESSKAPKRDVLMHRTWLLHWTLYDMFAQSKKVDPKILDFFLNEKSLSIISLSSPHLFRYVSACLILQKRLKHLVKETVWMINHESGSYSDPVTRFLLALYAEMDFDEAQRQLQRCELVCKGDHFLAPHWNEFQENARLHIFESYCRTHQCINIQMIASKLNMEAVEAELWIVKLIQNAKLDARIDSEKSRVVMTKAPPNVYQQVIEKTKNLAFRSTMLVSNLEKR